MDNSRSMVEMHSGICEDIAGNSTNISPKPEAPGSSPGRRTKSAVISTVSVHKEVFSYERLVATSVMEAAAFSLSMVDHGLDDSAIASISFMVARSTSPTPVKWMSMRTRLYSQDKLLLCSTIPVKEREPGVVLRDWVSEHPFQVLYFDQLTPQEKERFYAFVPRFILDKQHDPTHTV